MPLHDFRCAHGHVFDCVVGQGVDTQPCPRCGEAAEKVFLTAPAGFVQKDICYDSPVDGKAITSHWARQEDLKRNGCVEYEPGMRQDAERNRIEADRRLDKALDETADAVIAAWDARKREKLAAEMEGGLTVEPTRGTSVVH